MCFTGNTGISAAVSARRLIYVKLQFYREKREFLTATLEKKDSSKKEDSQTRGLRELLSFIVQARHYTQLMQQLLDCISGFTVMNLLSLLYRWVSTQDIQEASAIRTQPDCLVV
ncbi:hypothetical protein NC651_018150 [Populus alba x Populus x berolinensis]|nr:hypothetical protein NC651_018150 [Populus alba x Populus x berolinensis]